jgi:hypothetical protein
MGGQVYLAKGSLSNEPAERVVANRLELLGSKVADDGQWGGLPTLGGGGNEGKHTRGGLGKTAQAGEGMSVSKPGLQGRHFKQ